ncbi:MAG: methyl-accepting chemotaxis protein [Rhizobiales bacterium]|nr:methyl-accepting chemotaxis protein [Hyphomicrobiales bacterium]
MRLNSLQIKFGLGLLVASSLGIAISTQLAVSKAGHAVTELARVNWDKQTEAIAVGAAGGLKWKKADIVAESYAAIVADPEKPVDRIVALSATGETVAHYTREGIDAAAIDAAIKGNFAAAAQGHQSISLPDADLIIAAAPKGKDGKPQGYVGVAWRTDQINALRASLAWSLIAVQAAVLIGTLMFLLFTMRQMITGPLQRIAARIEEFSAGRYDGANLGGKRQDEVGVIMNAVDEFRDSAIRRQKSEKQTEQAVHELADALHKLSTGDLTHKIDKRFDGALDKLRQDWNVAVAKLEQAIAVISTSSTDLNMASEEIAQTSDELADRGERQASDLHDAATALQEVTQGIQETVRNVRDVTGAVHRARQQAAQASGVTQSAIDAMNRIAETSGQITKITQMIDEISFQTNLLALNAGVEAARAGDFGKGFAVVAVEVRALSQRSAEAAEDIKKLIANSEGQVLEGVKLVRSTAELLGQIAARVEEIDTLAGHVAEGAETQAERLGKVNTSIDGVSMIIQQNAAMSEESNAATQRLHQAAREVTELVGEFKVNGSPSRHGGRQPVAEQQKRVAALAGAA